MQLHHARAADQRRVNLEEGVLRCGSHQHQHAILHGVQQRVLLAAVEAVDLVDEQDGAQTERRQALVGGIDFAAQIRNRAADGRHLHERSLRRLGDDVRERGLARARRAEQDDRAQLVLLDGVAQPRAGAHRLVLADHFLERARTHAHCQGRHFRLPLVFHFGK